MRVTAGLWVPHNEYFGTKRAGNACSVIWEKLKDHVNVFCIANLSRMWETRARYTLAFRMVKGILGH